GSPEWFEPTGSHTPGDELYEANYTACGGGFASDFYECVHCGCPVDADGNEMQYVEGSGEHTLEQIPAKAPTYWEDGYKTFWACSDCGAAYLDAAGTTPVTEENVGEVLLPRLETEEEQRADVSAVEEVPASIAEEYETVDDVYQALFSVAVADANLEEESTGSVLLDVELQVKDPESGEWVAVAPNDFPAEGVEVLLPYPEGTGKNGFTFVITHMITAGEHAGTIETLPGTPETDGIRVKFTSMSPVVIAYQAKPVPPVIPSPQPEPEPEPEQPENPFVDVSPEQYYYDAVLWAVSEGITNGQTADTFAPLSDCSRAQVVTFLWRAAGSPEPVGTDSTFTDVRSGSDYEKAVQWAVENGITTGITDTAFCPDGAVTRAQVVTFLWRAAGSPNDYGVNSFDDVASGTYYADAVLWALKNGITLGNGANNFCPEDSCTRAQVVTFLYRCYVE
ncbi:MAG: S-layer homology domain-containing protein, partial [Oscillospiraceae bacterium]